MKGPALKIVLRPGKKPMGEDMTADEPGEYDDQESDDSDDVGDGAKREALSKLASALGVQVKDESAALDALETLIYHCTEGLKCSSLTRPH